MDAIRPRLHTLLYVFRQGLALTGVAQVKCVIVIAGAKIRAPAAVARAFDTKITCPSLHFIGTSAFFFVLFLHGSQTCLFLGVFRTFSWSLLSSADHVRFIRE